MGLQFTELAKIAAADGVVTADEILSLRRQGWGDGIITREEADAIFAINNVLTQSNDEWVDFMVEAIGEFVLNGTEPRGMCDEKEAQWLIAAIDEDGRLESMAELEVLVRVIEKAQNVPDSLKEYAIAQIEQAVLTGTGPTRDGGELSDSHVSAAECRMIRRVIFACGGYGPAAVSRFDAEMLFRLKDATLDADNAAEWPQLFVDGVANYLKGFHLNNAQLSHTRAKELEAFVADNKPNVGRFMRAVAREIPEASNHIGQVFGRKSNEGPSFAEQEQAGDELTSYEAKWLEAMIEADGAIDPLERQLLDAVKNADL